YNQWRLEKLSSPEQAARYLNAARRDSKEALLDAVKNVIQANQVARVAREAGVSRESVYRSFSAEGNPTFDTFDSVLAAVGVKIKFEASEVCVNPASSPRPQLTTASVGTSGFRTGRVNVAEEMGSWQGIGNTVGSSYFLTTLGTNIENSSGVGLKQGDEEPWPKIPSQCNLKPLATEGQMILPPAMQTTCSSSQLCGI
ncbi:MAG: addiction module antidote protein, partial [Candidatus Sulfotelmatobacter sp.]